MGARKNRQGERTMTSGRKPTPTALKLVKGNPGKQATLEADGRAFAEAINNDYQKKSRKAGGKTV